MNNENTIQLSHVLYRVTDLYEAVSKLNDAGFIVEYGALPEEAYNAFIWFEKGVFIEIYENPRLSRFTKWFMKIAGYKPILERMEKWESIDNSWCEWSLESSLATLQKEKDLFKTNKIPYRFHKTKRIDKDRRKLKWELLIPNDIVFPFIMSAYTPNPRPNSVKHPNGAEGVELLLIGSELLDRALLDKVLIDQTSIEFVKGAQGLQTVKLLNTDLKIEDILK
ncbi:MULTISPECIES: VOC family protein [Flavobacterium]|uniref:VOC family protein n=1 Tax=Flavobacterium TaxID=237 RepID=UPI001183E200|nr:MULTISPECIES: VOC family protein [Flavobacterium]MCR4029735.1 VOC family protein [Flavobacterium panacis]